MSITADSQALLDSVPSDGSSIGNLKLREILGWDEERYQAARQPLIDAGKLTTGRGRGGSVMRVDAATADQPPRSAFEQKSLKFEIEPRPESTKRQPAERNGGSSAFEQTFRNIDDVMWKDAGCTSELDYSEQSS